MEEKYHICIFSRITDGIDVDYLKKRAKDLENGIHILEEQVKDSELTDNNSRSVFPFRLVK